MYDPRTGRWESLDTSIPPLLDADGTPMGAWPHESYATIVLRDGTILVAGGCCAIPRQPTTCESGGCSHPLDIAEIYDPRKRRWRTTGRMKTAQSGPTPTLLADGTVLVTGGRDPSGSTPEFANAEVYNPRSGQWHQTGAMSTVRGGGQAIVLPTSGKVLVVGGEALHANGAAPATGDLYDPRSGTWRPTGPMITPTPHDGATLLPDGTVLVAGASYSSTVPPHAHAEIYNPATNAWTATPAMREPRDYPAMVLLPTGNVLTIGGEDPRSGMNLTSDGGEYYAAANLEVTPLAGTIGTVVTVTGAGFSPGDTVRLYWDTVGTRSFAAMVRTATGSLSLHVPIPRSDRGPRTLLAVSQRTGLAVVIAVRTRPNSPTMPPTPTTTAMPYPTITRSVAVAGLTQLRPRP